MCHKKRIILIVFFCVPFLTAATRGDSLNFSQMDFNLDGTLHSNSDWGRLDYSFEGLSTVKYLNLTVNGSWQIQNFPLISTGDVGELQHMICGFSLGNTPGVDVSSMNYGYSITDDVLSAGRPARFPPRWATMRRTCRPAQARAWA